MLPKNNRLTKKKDFELVFNLGKSVKDGFLLYKVVKGSAQQSRFGFIVSKKISNKAVVRNKVRRRMQKAVGDAFRELAQPVDVVLIALSGIQEKEFSQVQEKVVKFLNKINQYV